MKLTYFLTTLFLITAFYSTSQARFLNDEQRQQIKDARAKGEKPDLSAILTPEQLERFEEKKAKREERLTQRAEKLGITVDELKEKRKEKRQARREKRQERLANRAETLGISVDELKEKRKERRVARRENRQERRQQARENGLRDQVRDQIRDLAKEQGVDLKDPQARREFFQENKDQLPSRDRRRQRRRNRLNN